MTAIVRRAMIMGAGLGTRMRPLTDDRPKPLVTVADRTLIDHALDRLVAAGVETAVVNIHYKAEMMRAHLARRHDIEIRFSDESGKLLGTGGGLIKALPLLENEPFFVLNSDSIWVESGTPALTQMMDTWTPDRMDALLLLADMTTALGYDGHGDFSLDADHHLARARDHAGMPFAYLGTQIAHPRLFADAPIGEFSTNLLWDRAITRGRLFGTRLDGTWLHVGTPQARADAEAFLAKQPA